MLASIFMVFYESKWLNEYNIHKLNFYLRYVDSILATFDNEQDLLNLLDFLNKRHPNIKFMMKKQINFLMHSFQVSIIKISHFKPIINRPIQTFS